MLSKEHVGGQVLHRVGPGRPCRASGRVPHARATVRGGQSALQDTHTDLRGAQGHEEALAGAQQAARLLQQDTPQQSATLVRHVLSRRLLWRTLRRAQRQRVRLQTARHHETGRDRQPIGELLRSQILGQRCGGWLERCRNVIVHCAHHEGLEQRGQELARSRQQSLHSNHLRGALLRPLGDAKVRHVFRAQLFAK